MSVAAIKQTVQQFKLLQMILRQGFPMADLSYLQLKSLRYSLRMLVFQCQMHSRCPIFPNLSIDNQIEPVFFWINFACLCYITKRFSEFFVPAKISFNTIAIKLIGTCIQKFFSQPSELFPILNGVSLTIILERICIAK